MSLAPRIAVLKRSVAAALSPARPGRQVTIHLGPHKTGTTTIQRLLRDNRRLLAPHLTVIGPTDPQVQRLARLARKGRKPAKAEEIAPDFEAAARALARSCRHLPRVLVSSEDLLGPLPARYGVKGLYRAAPFFLAALARAFEAEGATPRFAFYLRPFDEWLGSLGRQLAREGKQDFIADAGLPDSWQPVTRRLSAVVAPGRFVTIDFTADAGERRLGTALLALAGVPGDRIAALDWPRAARVLRPETVEPGRRG